MNYVAFIYRSLGLFAILLAVSCSALKLDRDSNCLNERAACFVSDTTPPALDRTVVPAPNTAVSTLPEIQLLFSEELNEPQPQDFVFTAGDTGMQIISVEKINKFTYRLKTNRNPIIGGPLTLSFSSLKDYNGNRITNGSITYTIDLTIPVTTTPNHYGVSTGGYPNISVQWSHTYTPVLAGATTYTVRLTTGSTDCSAGTPVTPVTSDATVGVTPLVSGTNYNFSLDTSVITSLGAQVILVCVTNTNNNKHGTGTINIVRDDSAPSSLTVSPSGGNYVSPQVLTFACSDNTDKIIYDSATNVFSGIDPLASAVPEPTFNTSTGAVTSGNVFSASSKPQTPYSGDTTRTIYKYRCIDQAGNIYPPNASPALVSGVYRVNSTYPTVTLASLTRTGAVPAVAITGVGAGGHTSATLQWSTNQAGQAWEIRSGGTDCGVGGTLVDSGSGGTATPTPAGTPITTTILPTSPGIALGLNDLRVCVTNGTDWGQAGLTLLRDDSAPTTQTVNVPAGNYGASQALVFICSDNEDRVIYTMATSKSWLVPSDPGDPTFDAEGRVTFGTVQSGPVVLNTDPTGLEGQKYLVKWRCIDKAGHPFASVSSGTYLIDTLLPTVIIQNQDRTAISTQAGAYNSAQITWKSDRFISAYDIRRGSTNCTDGVVLSSGTNLSGASVAANTSIVSTIDAGAANLPGGENNYAIHVCVSNYATGKGYATVQLRYDITPPTIPTPLPNISQVDATNFTVTWTAAADSGAGIAGYRIFRSLTAGLYGVTPDYIATSSPATIAMPDTQKYYLQIVPYDAAGNVPTTPPTTYSEVSTKPSITLVVTGLGASKSFNITDGTSSTTVSGNTAGSTWVTALATGGTYNFRVTAQPSGQNCAVKELQFGQLDTNKVLNVNCATGYGVGQSFNSVPAAKLGYKLFQGKNIAVAGSGTATWANGTGAGASFSYPEYMAHMGGYLYVSDTNNFKIRRVAAGTGTVDDLTGSSVVGPGSSGVGTAADNGTSCADAKLGQPMGIAIDGTNLYVAEINLGRIRKISDIAGTCRVTILAGTGTSGFQDGAGSVAQFNNPREIVSNNDYLYVADNVNHRIRRVSLSTGVVDTLAGNGVATDAAGTGTAAGISFPVGLTLVGSTLYTGTGANRIMAIDINTQVATIVAGDGNAGYADAAGTSARFNGIYSIATDGYDLYIAEIYNNVIRRVEISRGYRTTTLAGAQGQPGDVAGVVGSAARFNVPHGIASDGRNIFVANHTAHSIRKLADNGMVGYWPLNGTANDYASDVTTPQNGVENGAPLINAVDRFGNATAYSLDGVDDFISAPGTNLPTGSQARTLCAWLSLPDTSNSGNDGIVTYGRRGPGTVFGLRLGNPQALIAWHATSDLGFQMDAQVGKWTHACITNDGSSERVYYNGHFMAQASLTLGTISGNICIGQRSNTSGTATCDGGTTFLKGSIADVRVYNRTLNEGEINELAQDASGTAQVGNSYNTGAVGLMSHYQFSPGGAAPLLTDAGPLNYTLTTANGPAFAIGTDGDANGVYAFNGSSQYLNAAGAGTGLPLGTTPRTICAWVSPEVYLGSQVIASYGAASDNNAFGLKLYNNNQVAITAWNNDAIANISIPLNTWTHLCGTFDGSTPIIYRDGIAASTGSFTGAISTTSGGVVIGKNPGASGAGYFQGKIDDVRIYNTVLSAFQVRQLATQVPTGLVARYDFSGDKNDVSGFGQDLNNNGANLGNDRFSVASAAATFSSNAYFDLAMVGLPIGNAARTICAWTRPTSLFNGTFSEVVMYGTSSTGWGYGMDASGGLPNGRFFILNPSGDRIHLKPHGIGVWRHVCMTFDSTNENFYIDGVNVMGGATTLSTAVGSLFIGRGTFGSADYFNGSIDDVRIYNRALSVSEIAAIAQLNKRIFVSGAGYNPGIDFTSPATADDICNRDVGRPAGGSYKAMIVDTSNRIACTTASCGGGATEHVDWVFAANTLYYNSAATLPVATTTGVGLLPATLTNAIAGNTKYWTGIKNNWTTDNMATCSDWSTNASGNALQGNAQSTTTSNVLNGWGNVGCNISAQQLLCVEQ